MKQYHQIIFGILIGLLASGLVLLISRPEVGEPIALSPAPTPTKTSPPKPTSTALPILVHIEGEVNLPGVYSLYPNSRLEDLISLAGGLTGNADQKQVNLALLVRDGDYIFVPGIDQEIPSIARNAPNNLSADQDNLYDYPLNINEADQAALETLPGIGPAKAADIIDYRTMIGAFTNLEELLDISGIGPTTLEALRDYLICEP
ncbi:MAG: helix-hairpin-helix domain-containing protein [Chloroflexota bacterium]|nr:helix-hairpin-helix domain-containing protein [Chloroflexota bacterium]